MTTLAEMRSEVAREHGWHLDDDGDRIDAELNERFGQAAVEMYAALERCENFIANTEGELGITLESGTMARKAMAMARGQS